MTDTKITIERDLELIDGMIEVQLHHAEQCDRMANRTMAEKQKGWDMERVALLRKMRAALAAQPATRRLPLAQATAPREIWLQISDDKEDRGEQFPESHEGITWCQDSVLGCEVRYVREDLAAQPAEPVEPVAWRDHVEQRIRTWRQRNMNKSGDRLAIDDFMGQESIDDLVDFVCDEYAAPPAPAAVPPGYKLVPIVPTPGMIASGAVALMKASHSDIDPTMEEVTAAYHAMIRAAGDKP